MCSGHSVRARSTVPQWSHSRGLASGRLSFSIGTGFVQHQNGCSSSSNGDGAGIDLPTLPTSAITFSDWSFT